MDTAASDNASLFLAYPPVESRVIETARDDRTDDEFLIDMQIDDANWAAYLAETR